ncbi:hypothetical protein BCR34DRAFT_256792 [Clohesyomyces aquaticus]|uniref:Uncharacterized protein n=1 Tax=Clohesyomyces aquaticus TaxID=1231657 RepID=A0A1Y1ZU09_9PLEO|nr:hypothetical protein BCR34DRAFT_256792 [Clohesyomyces aquaticus]
MSTSSCSLLSGISSYDQAYKLDSSYSATSPPPRSLKRYFSPRPRRGNQRPLTPASASCHTYCSAAVGSISLVKRAEPQAPKPVTASEIASVVEEAIEDCASVETKYESAIESCSPVEDELPAVAGRGVRWGEETRHQYYREPVPDKRGIPIPGIPEKEPLMHSIPFAGQVHNRKDNITDYCARGVSGWSTFAQYRMDQAEAQIPQPSGVKIGWHRLSSVKRKDVKIVRDDDEFSAGCNVREINVARWNQQHNSKPMRNGPGMP